MQFSETSYRRLDTPTVWQTVRDWGEGQEEIITCV